MIILILSEKLFVNVLKSISYLFKALYFLQQTLKRKVKGDNICNDS